MERIVTKRHVPTKGVMLYSERKETTMEDKLTLLDESFIEKMADLFKKAFAGEPWNDDWSDRVQLLEYVKEISGGYNALNYGIVRDGKLVAMTLGMVRHWWEGTNYNIEELCVDPDFQGQGIGSRLLKLVEEEIKQKGFHGIFLQTDSDKPAFKFYTKNGFNNLEKHVSLYKGV